MRVIAYTVGIGWMLDLSLNIKRTLTPLPHFDIRFLQSMCISRTRALQTLYVDIPILIPPHTRGSALIRMDKIHAIESHSERFGCRHKRDFAAMRLKSKVRYTP